MCGIAGLIGKHKNENSVRDAIDLMIESIKWRGPDAKGLYVNSIGDSVVGLAHRRLSILDLSEHGSQPMEFADGRFAITYNGEIYNYKEIRESLTKKGHTFVSDCDTEVVLHACVEYGVEQAVSHFNGMWAFAFSDRDAGVITLSRDRLGVKPLYYTIFGDSFAFASDMRAFFELPDFDKVLNYIGLHGYLWNMYVPAPYSIFKNVSKLPPGCILEYNVHDKKERITKYWDANAINIDFAGTYKEYVDKIEKLLYESVKLRLEADVPVGVFLSGGIDSSVIVSLAQEQSDRTINTYSIGFTEKENDDAKVANTVAKILGTNHQELYCTQKDALELIQKIPDAYAEPFADNSQMPTMLLSRMTRKYVTVALSGDGGDELFIGYPSFVGNEKLLGRRTRTGFLNPMLKFLSCGFDIYNHRKWMIDKFYNAKDITSVINLNYITAKNLIDSIMPFDLSGERLLLQYGGDYYEKRGLDIVRSSVLQSVQYGLADDMLTKVDRASMFYSLECRCPILDYRIAECSLSVPNDYNLHHGELKAPLKEILYRYVPKEIINRPKSGFGVPINEWLHGELKEIANDNLADEFIRRQGIFDPNGVRRFLAEFNRQRNPILDRIAYTLLMFQLWWRNYCDAIKCFRC